MIFSLLLRNFKTYQGINYIALSNSQSFTALVGENGAGKSSVLEAFDSYFNSAEWNLHNSVKSFQEREPFICPIFLIKKDLFPKQNHEWFINKLSEITWNAKPTDFNPSGKSHAELFTSHREDLAKFKITSESHYLFPLGIIKRSRYGQPVTWYSIFETLPDLASLQNYQTYTEAVSELQKTIQSYYSYIYLRSDLDLSEHTKLESITMQALLGQKIDQIVRALIDKRVITSLNSRLSDFLEEISGKLINYEYRKPGFKQNLVNTTHFTETIISSYFGTKVLTKKSHKSSVVPVSDLSSGEKRQALIDVAQAFLLSSDQNNNKQIILAIDEPELSLHVSACFNQFEKLKKVSQTGIQVILTTHWYGFMPIVSEGVAVYCPKSDAEPVMLDLRCFREDLKKLKKETSGRLPTEFELKGVNDLVQSIIASVTAGNYRWIICEGSSDKIYLDFYTGNEYLIVAVGGSPALKKIYRYIELALAESTDDIKGKIYFLLDTDKKYEKFDTTHKIKNVQIKRIKNNEDTHKTELMLTSDNEFHPATVIEDALSAEFFLKTLQSFSQDPQLAHLIPKIEANFELLDQEAAPSYALDLTRNQIRQIDEVFAQPGFKVRFALRYIEIADPAQVPPWIGEIAKFLSSNKPRRKQERK